MITFGVKQVGESTVEGQGLSWDGFKQLADLLSSRQLTGNVAQLAIEVARGTATKDQWNLWYRRILIKDLRCGVSEKTINKVVEKNYADYAIPVFTCQLAHDSANHESKVTGKKFKANATKPLSLPKRTARLCEGCPYWFAFPVLK